MPRPHRPFREHLPFAPSPEPYFRWRGAEITRIEGFSDAVFAFAVSLLVVALEVPHTLAGLMDVLRGFPAFGASFVMLYLFWSYHYRYFRRYGLEDTFSKWMNAVLLLLVLFSVYPLKFLFSLMFQGFFVDNPHPDQVSQLNNASAAALLSTYGVGIAGIFGCYAAFYFHAYRQRGHLRLTHAEEILTLSAVRGYLIAVFVCVLSIVFANVGMFNAAGLVYLAIAIAVPISSRWHKRAARRAEEAWQARREAATRR